MTNDHSYEKLFPFWEKLSEKDKEKLYRFSYSVKYSSGTVIHGGSSECTGAIIVKKGCIRVYIMSEEGREITLYRLYSDDVCMLSASCVLKSITFDVLVDAAQDSECIIVNGKALSEISEQNIYVKNYALETAVSRFSDVMWIMQQILFMSLDKRLAIFLQDEMQKTESDKIHLTHEQIAKYMGSAREAVSRMLKHFSNEGIVTLSRNGVQIIDRKKLGQLTV